jgi:AcrR family transcriptional regulator
MSIRDRHLGAAMAGRPVDHQRRAELLDAVVDYAVERGLSEVSWRPVSAALGISPTALVHYFGSKEQMLVAILGRLRERILAATSDWPGEQPGLATAARAAWTRTSDPSRESEFRLFFAVYGRALQAPQQFAEFLDRVVAEWMNVLVDAQGPGTDRATAARTATLVIATIRGLLLDLLATGDRARVQDAAETFLATLQHTAAEHTAAEHTAAEHTAAEHTAAGRTAAGRTAARRLPPRS